MEGPEPSGNGDGPIGGKRRESADQVRVRRETLQAVLEQCQRALELLKNADEDGGGGHNLPEEVDDDSSASSVSSQCGSGESETAELCDLLKSRVESPNFLEKLGSIHMSIPQNVAEEGSSWDVVSKTDWDEDSDKDDYVVVKQEDIVEGIACFMAAYLLSLNQTKELTPIQLQEALSKTFSVKKRKGKLRKAWDGSKVIYNVASWGATAIGIYQNPALFSAASAAFWTSCRVISKLL
ncbi:uncharacterized protein LOC131242417 isoform X2 [Magnolia sinica]|uniref:uncharacterized protein LOC131242417 isoform X2 n=1 Tax=Magnolia sinica TaxID=86752 RepID=UPI0026586284|nr:uncharacterized protein LOC131242417 isoform X2 [Magnolia sinica]